MLPYHFDLTVQICNNDYQIPTLVPTLRIRGSVSNPIGEDRPWRVNPAAGDNGRFWRSVATEAERVCITPLPFT